MTEKIIKTIQKVDAESEKSGAFGKAIAEYVINKLLKTEENAEKIGNKKFTDLMNGLNSKARKELGGKNGAIRDDVIYSWVRDFYGVEEASESSPAKAKIIPLDSFDPFA